MQTDNKQEFLISQKNSQKNYLNYLMSTAQVAWKLRNQLMTIPSLILKMLNNKIQRTIEHHQNVFMYSLLAIYLEQVLFCTN